MNKRNKNWYFYRNKKRVDDSTDVNGIQYWLFSRIENAFIDSVEGKKNITSSALEAEL